MKLVLLFHSRLRVLSFLLLPPKLVLWFHYSHLDPYCSVISLVLSRSPFRVTQVLSCLRCGQNVIYYRDVSVCGSLYAQVCEPVSCY